MRGCYHGARLGVVPQDGLITGMNRVAEDTELPGKPLGNGLAEPARLSDAEISLLQLRAEERRYAAGDPLIRAGDPGDHIYLILEGRASVEPTAHGDGPRIAEERGPGELFGILAFFPASPVMRMFAATLTAVLR